ncbi:MAG: hypothetical protein O2779_03930 [Nanoarchaeota archaeon]|nr:hypothetical protein [Nanoarchaeota archaeon]
MKTAIIVSKKDIAGMNIAKHLEYYDLAKCDASLHVLDLDTVHAENIVDEVEADFYLFATRHAAASGKPSLSCHIAGNWGEAEYGGQRGKLCMGPAVILKEAFLELHKQCGEMEHEITLEATHHGPLLLKPCLFIEIGSKEEDWKNMESGNVMAKVIFSLLSRITQVDDKPHDVVVGLGGGHYPPRFNKIQLETDIAVGHICPKHHLSLLDEAMLREAIAKSFPVFDYFLLDWKGLGSEKSRIVSLLDSLELSYKRADQL